MSNITRHKTLVSELGLLYCAAIWGATFFVVKESLSGIDPVILVAYRFLISGALIGAWLLFKRKRLFADLKAGIVLGAILWVLYVSQTIGLKYTTASNSGFITGLFVAFVPMLSFLIIRYRPTRADLLTVLIAVAGLWFLTGGITGANRGDFLTLISAAAYAAHLLFSQRFIRSGISVWTLCFQQFTFVGVLSLLAGSVFTLPFEVANVNVAMIVLFLALFPTVSAFVVQLFAQKFTPAIRVSLIFALEPVFAALFAWTLGDEKMIPARALGGLLIVAAMVVSAFSISRSAGNRTAED